MIRVALLPDFAEEHWPSMDLFLDMLSANVNNGACASIVAQNVRPPFRSIIAGLPWVRGYPRNIDRLVNRSYTYPHALAAIRERYDVFHILDHSYSHLALSVPADRTVITCHDLDTFRCLLDPGRDPRPRWFRAITRRILSGFQRASAVICVSQTTREEIRKYGLIEEKRLHVAYPGVHPCFSPSPGAADNEVTRWIRGSSSQIPVLLHVGSTIPRKRIEHLLRVFARVRRAKPDALLLRVGGPLTDAQARLARELKIADAIRTLPFLEREALAAIYRNSTLLLLPSASEGFGLPLIESLASGCPVIASDIPVFREVGEPAVRFLRLDDVDQWTAAVLELLDEAREYPERRAVRRRASILHARQFDWNRTAFLTTQVYRELVGGTFHRMEEKPVAG
jgi:glycosyltransferase involved in cell wall biosynthesis